MAKEGERRVFRQRRQLRVVGVVEHFGARERREFAIRQGSNVDNRDVAGRHSTAQLLHAERTYRLWAERQMD